MLDFSLDGSEHIRIKCDEVSQDIKYFFDYEFNKQFDSDEMIIDVPHFLRNINNINRFLAKNKSGSCSWR